MRVPFLLGRLMFGGYFIMSGINHFKHQGSTWRRSPSLLRRALEPSWRPRTAASASAGTSVLLGIKPKLGAAATIGFLAGFSPVMHNFWKMEQPEQRMNDMINFTKNMALAVALLNQSAALSC